MEIIHVNDEEQLKLCLQIRREVFVAEQGVPEELERDEYDTMGKGHHVLALEGNEPIGAARLIAYDEQTAKLQRIAVRKPWRGSGVGQRLLAALEQKAKQLGFSFTLLDAQTHSRGFYEKAGYAPVTGEIFMEAGIEHVRMKKRL